MDSDVATPLLEPITFEGRIDADYCAHVKKIGSMFPARLAHTANDGVTNYRHAITRRVFKDERSAELWSNLLQMLLDINASAFGLDVTEIMPPDYLVYGPGYGHFGWHSDISYKDENLVRKVTMIVQLSEPTDYDGGELQVFAEGPRVMPKRRGTVVSFPAFCQHQIMPVTRGVRESLVVFGMGPRFR